MSLLDRTALETVPIFTNSNLNRDSRYLIFLDRIVSEVHLSFSQSFIEDIFRTEIFVFILKLFVVYFDQKEDDKSCHIDLMVVRKQLLFNLIIQRISILFIMYIYLSIQEGLAKGPQEDSMYILCLPLEIQHVQIKLFVVPSLPMNYDGRVVRR